MRRIDTLRRTPERARTPFPATSWQEVANILGRQYGIGGAYGSNPAASFEGYVRGVAECNGVVAAAITARAMLISQVRFTWRDNRTSPTPGRLSGDHNLAVLERPGSMTRPELLHLAEEDVSCAGTFYAYKEGNSLFRLRPDWVKVVLGSDSEPVDGWIPPDARITGFVYGDPSNPNGRKQGFLPNEIIQWKPEPHPLEWWRGQSWITAVMQEIHNDGQASEYTSKFFDNAATPNMVFTMDPTLTADQVQAYADVANAKYAGSSNAFKNMYLGGGTGVEVVGSTDAAISLRDVTGGYESRIASRSRVPAVVLGIREGMAGSALNSGNYAQTRRLWADGWFTPSVQSLCAACESVVKPPAESDLWYDSSEVLFLQEDAKDNADIQNTKSQAIRQLTDAGYDPDSVIEAIESNDFNLLKHNGLYSVQLQAPGSVDTNGDPTASQQATESEETARGLAEMVQKIYLGVGKVVTQEEARTILNRAGADLDAAVVVSPLPAPPAAAAP